MFDPISLAILAILFFSAYHFYMFRKLKGSDNDVPLDIKLNLPPSPPTFPILGNIHQLSPLLHQSFYELSKTYGPVMLLRFFKKPMLIVSCVEMATHILKTHDSIFLDRLTSKSIKLIFYNGCDIALAPYGERWKKLRKFCVLEMLSMKRVQSFKFIRQEEVDKVIENITRSSLERQTINLTEIIFALANSVIFRCSLGDNFKKDYADRFSELMMKATSMDMFVAGSHTTAAITEWTMSELIKNPKIMKKAQEEVRSVVGNKTRVEEKDINQMNYLKCVVKETLRLHAPVPTVVRMNSSDSVKIGGYDIPSNTGIFINIWAIQRNPKYWDKPEEFCPERFESNPIDFKGQDFEFIPFGSGRRGCPGVSFGLAVVELLVANLLYRFDWKLPGGASYEDLDMSEDFGMGTCNRKIHLHVIPTLFHPAASS
ncbi:cytochrome P450 71A1-like isoform X2 [Papaver somniferum]|uniref:cytochrome P450 71A1-like isoform X2 n=1 Tax=Papaver somniferum TaxID=3469 RepID=UPI000E6F9B2E|nr:cytochrome P450 71A1-like isoform X2 [Papaver somniferum]